MRGSIDDRKICASAFRENCPDSVEVSSVKIRYRGATVDGERIRFSSANLPKWARRTRSLDALLPVLYLTMRGPVRLRISQPMFPAFQTKVALPSAEPQLRNQKLSSTLRDC